MELKKLVDRVDRMKKDNPSLRWGQCLSNMLSEENPVLLAALEKCDKDPFYADNKDHPKCVEALKFLDEEWYK